MGAYVPLALAVATAAILQAVHVARSPTISADGITLVAIARDLPRAGAETFRRHDQHPGYPAMLLGAARLVQGLGYRADPESWALGGIIVSYLAGLGSVAMVWLLARNLFDARAANLAAFAFAVLPVPVWNAGDAHSDVPHMFFYLLAAWLASWGVVSGRLLPLAAAGAGSALAYWVRPEGAEVLLVALACLVWQSYRAQWTWRRTGLTCASLAGAAVLIAAPYPILAGKFTSKQLPFTKTQPAQTFIDLVATTEASPKPAMPQAGAVDPAAVTIDSSAPTTNDPSVASSSPASPTTDNSLATAEFQSEPRRYSASLWFRLLGKAVGAFLYSICQGFKFVFIPFYLIGHIECARRKPEWLQVGMLALLGLTHFVVLVGVFVLSGYIAHRHVLPMIALAMPFTALGIIDVGERVARRFRWPADYVVPTVLALCAAGVLPYTVRALNREFVPVMEATRWVQQHAPPGSGIVCNSPYVEFYGSLPVTYLDHASQSLDEALATAKTAARYDYVVLHVNAHGYRSEWLAQLAARYRQVLEFPDPYSGRRPKKVLVFEAKDGHVLRPSERRAS